MKGDDWKGWQALASVAIRPHSISRGCDWKKYHGVVIESDDWGLCGEGKDKATHERLTALGYHLDSKPGRLNFANTLETVEDLQKLYETLGRFSDRLGRNPVFTANFVMTNPFYSRISNGGFSKFHFMPVTDGFSGSWASRNSALDGWRTGIKNRLLVPEYHGFAHFNHEMWLDGLKKGDRRLLDFFNEEMFTSSRWHSTISEYGTVGPQDITYESLWSQLQDMAVGCGIFLKAFNRHPRSTIPPHDISNPQTLIGFARMGITLVQSERRTLTGILGVRPFRPKSAIRAISRILAQLTIVFRGYRNVRLEPEETRLSTEVVAALEASYDIMRKGLPVVVGSHRQNYVGGVEQGNGELGRRRLASYLAGIVSDPKLVFLSSFEASQLSLTGRSIEKFGDEFLVRNYTRGDKTIWIADGGRHTVVGMMGEQPGGTLVKDIEGGAKVYVPAGKAVLVLSGDSRDVVR